MNDGRTTTDAGSWVYYKLTCELINSLPVRSFTGMDRNGPNYRNGLPDWTLICAIEYFLCILLGQSGLELPQKLIGPRNMKVRYPKIWLRSVGQ